MFFFQHGATFFFSEAERFAGSLRASAHGGFTLAAYGVLHQVEPLILHLGWAVEEHVKLLAIMGILVDQIPGEPVDVMISSGKYSK